MRRPRLITTLLVAAAAALVGAAFAALPPESPRAPRAVIAGGDAFVLGDPALLAGPRIRNVYPSPDGPYVLIVREPPVEQITRDAGLPAGGQTQFLLWNRVTGRVSVIWSEPFTGRTAGGVSTVEWLPGTTAALAVVGRYTLTEQAKDVQGERRLLLIDTRQARPRDLGVLGPEDVLMTGDVPFAAVYTIAPSAPGSGDARGQVLRKVGADGRFSPPVSVPDGVNVMSFYGLDASDGAYAMRQDGKDPATGRRKVTFFAVGLQGNPPRALPSRPQRPADGAAARVGGRIATLPVRLTTRGASLRLGAEAGAGEDHIRAAYLERNEKAPAPAGAKDSRALVAADADAVTLTPDGDAALYRTSAGALYAAPIQKQPAEAFVGARREFWRTHTIFNAKQVALGILSYTQDYDNTLPPAGDIAGVVNPYVKMPEVFQNPETGQTAFTFLRPPGSGNLSDVPSPAATIIGYLQGPGGRAAVYLDGHVKWEEAP